RGCTRRPRETAPESGRKRRGRAPGLAAGARDPMAFDDRYCRARGRYCVVRAARNRLELRARLHPVLEILCYLREFREYSLAMVEPEPDIVIGARLGLRSVLERVAMVAPSDLPVLLFGETGTGKEVIARVIHNGSVRCDGPFWRVNCGALAPELVDSELFGHERGSFTGAIAQRKGWFEQAHRGTLFLDEVAELSPAVQVRLLRVLQEGELV